MTTAAQARRVVIIGGGPAGAVVALTLARRGLKPLVLEAQKGRVSKVGECLPPNVNPLLAQLGLTDLLRGDGHLASHGNRSLWGSSTPVERDFLFGTKGSGWQLDRRKFEESLAEAARGAGAEWRDGCRLVKCARQKRRWSLQVKTPAGDEIIDADFVVDATGRAARFARQLGLRPVRYDRLIGAALFLESEPGGGIKDSFTLVEAVASGWWYSARLPENKLVVAYMTDSDLVDHTEIRSTEGWSTLLEKTEQTKRRIIEGNYHPSIAPRILAANSTRLDTIEGERWLAVGDAATAYDPLSSYGISSAMGAGFYAALAIADFFDGSQDALPAYSRLVRQAYARYLVMHRQHYDNERRWPQELFWKRRHTRAVNSVDEEAHSPSNLSGIVELSN